MKKLMFAAAAIAAGVAVADVTSANVVGYDSEQSGGVKYLVLGSSFFPVTSTVEDKYRLGDVVIENIDPDTDQFQLVNGSDLMTTDKALVYLTKEAATQGGAPELAGWWDAKKGGIGNPNAAANDAMIDIGQAFLCKINSLSNFKITSSGEVPNGETYIETKGAHYPFFANYLPREIPLNWIRCENCDPDIDQFQVINASDLMTTDAVYVYLTIEAATQGGAPELAGWWNVKKGGIGNPAARPDDTVTLKPGQGFLCKMNSLSNVKVIFPSAFKAE